MNPIRINDFMVSNDDLVITNKIKTECAAPHGRLFQVLGVDNGRRVVKEIACNTVVVGGAITALENLTGATANWKPSTLNATYGINAPVASGTPKLALFGIGKGSANLDFGSYVDPNVKQKDILDPIPLRYCESVTGDDASKYFMKVKNSDGITNSWYLKQFSSTPIIKTCWKNSVNDETGTEILSGDIHESQNTEGIETFTELQIDMNTFDGREYFEATGKLKEARYNTFGFYTGSYDPKTNEYADVRLYSAVAFNNRGLDLSSKSQFIYRIYSLI